MTPLHQTATQAKRLQRNADAAAAPVKPSITRAKSLLMTDYNKLYMEYGGVRVMTVEILHSKPYLDGLKKYFEAFLSLKLEAMKKGRTK